MVASPMATPEARHENRQMPTKPKPDEGI